MIQEGIGSFGIMWKEGMMTTVKAKFDGQVFVPCQPVDLPKGTTADVIIPDPLILPDPPYQPTEEEQRIFEEIRKDLAAAPPPVGSFDDYLRYKRGEL
jgi:hypothetical protein